MQPQPGADGADEPSGYLVPGERSRSAAAIGDAIEERAVFLCEQVLSGGTVQPARPGFAAQASHVGARIGTQRCPPQYEGELHEAPHPRSVEGVRSLAAMRGHEVGIAAAEAFELIRRVQR